MIRAIINNLRWQSDWNGYEVGYDNLNVVGLYTSDELECDFYVDMETNNVLEIMPHSTEEE